MSKHRREEGGDVRFVAKTLDGLSGKNVSDSVWIGNKLAPPNFTLGKAGRGEDDYSRAGCGRCRAAISEKDALGSDTDLPRAQSG